MRRAYGDCDVSDPGLVETYDDLPLWSAAFGLRLLELVDYRPGLTAVDVGCGTGFPLVELAERLGRASHVHGVDVWAEALGRAARKLKVRGVGHVTLHHGSAEALPLPDASVDLIVSNNGLNNVQDLERALAECARVARPGAQLVFTWNLPDTMRELYAVLEAVLAQQDGDVAHRIRQHIHAKRKPLTFMKECAEASGFQPRRTVEDSFCLQFADGSAMFDHSFMRLAFIGSWLELVEPPRRLAVFSEVEAQLNTLAARQGGLRLSVPFACLDCRRS